MLCLLLTMCLHADPISKEQAHETARAFLAGKGITMTTDATPAYKARRRSAAAEVAGYYIFNAGGDRGYVIVSGDDRTEAVLGYTDSGEFDPATAPEGMMAWLKGYLEFVDRLDSEGVTKETAERKARQMKAQKVRHAIQPLVTSRWNQGDPYNLLCPRYYNADGTQGDRSATGCVATALAQVMYFYKWPDAVVKSIPRYSFDSNGHQISMPSIPKGTEIDWANMTDIYDGQSTDEQKNAVAELMVYVGTGVKMGYGPSSGAGFNGGKPLAEYFGYDDATHSEYRSNYTLDEWTDLIYNEIATGHPVAFAGTASGGAHAFVVDGYDGDGLFHLNWGWGGGSDGYFRIEILNPGDNSGIGASSSSDGYSMGQEALILRLPDGVEADDTAMMTINDTEIRGDEIFSNYINWTGETNSFDYGIGYVAEDGSLVSIGKTSRADNLGANYYYGGSFGISGLEEGVYTVVPISKTTGSDVWKTSFNIKDRHIIADVKADGSYTLEMYTRPVDLAIEAIEFTGDRTVNRQQKLDVTFRNNTEEFYGEIYLFASKTGDKGGQASRSALSLKKGHTTTLTFFFTPKETGTYNVWLTYDGAGNNVVPGGHTTVDITATPAADAASLQVSSMTFSNITSGTIYGDFIEGQVRVKNNARTKFEGNVKLNIWRGEIGQGTFWSLSNTLLPASIEPGETVSLPFRFDNLTTGMQYGFNVEYGTGGELASGGLGNVNRLMDGVIAYKADGSKTASAPTARYIPMGDIVAVDLRHAPQVTMVNASRAPEALFFIGEDMETPSGLESAQVVKGGTAGDVTVSDSYGFFSPVNFTARTMSYSRVVDKAGMGGSWETIALPFRPESVTADGVPVGINTEKGLLLKEFSMADEGAGIFFETTDAMQDGVPYIFSVTDESLVGKTLVFSASDVDVAASDGARIVAGTDSYSFYGTTVTLTDNGIYVLNDAGTAFTLATEEADVKPFRAYFRTKLPDGLRAAQLPINTVTDGIEGTETGMKDGETGVYGVDGVRVGTATVRDGHVIMPQLPKGIYIVNGRKVAL